MIACSLLEISGPEDEVKGKIMENVLMKAQFNEQCGSIYNHKRKFYMQL